MSDKLLEVKNLVVEFATDTGTVRAVDKIDFTVFRGETIGIVGESGSGKSVTSLAVMGLIPQPPGRIAAGSIEYYDEKNRAINLLSLSEKEMNQYRGNEMAMIFQEPMTSLNPVFTCGNQVLEAIQLHLKLDKKAAKESVLDLFQQVQLPDPERIYSAYPHEISGGQKQRVMIAMAMSCHPKLLIADEPTTALDVTVQKAILQLMANLKRDLDAAVIFISHDLAVIAEIADRVLVMYKGRVVEQGKVADIFHHPKHPYTKGLLACRPPLAYRVDRLPVIADFMSVEKNKNGEIFITEKEASVVAKLGAVRSDPEKRKKRLAGLYTQPPILEVKNLNTWFSAKKNFFGKTTSWIKAVNDVSFLVYPGETLGLVGESGCGKTTLGRSIIGLNQPQSGEILYNGNDLLKMNTAELQAMRREIQIIFQDPYGSLNPRMTIGAAIMEPVSVHRIVSGKKMQKEYVIDLMETVSLKAEHFDRYPHEFSGGQRQRVGIARALALNPRFLICDESVSALDVSVQAQVLNLLSKLQKERSLTYIFISHDLSVVKFMSDRMMVMNAGSIEELDDADTIYTHPKAAYTKRLIDAIPVGLANK